MACLAAVRGHPYYDIRALADALPEEPEKPSPAELYRQQLLAKYGQAPGTAPWLAREAEKANGGGA
jgi:hypothetical protein